MRRFLRSLPLLLAAGIAATLFVAYGSIALVDPGTITPVRGVQSYDGHVQWTFNFGYAPATVRIIARRMMRQAWGVDEACGPPNSVGGDERTAWASDSADGADEWLELDYDHPIQPAAIRIYENYNPGAIVKVTLFDDSTGGEEVVWQGQPAPLAGGSPNTAQARTLTLPISTTRRTKRVRLNIASRAVPGWNEIDAVALVDSAGTPAWATRARASSTYRGGKDGDDATRALPYWVSVPPSEPADLSAPQDRIDIREIEGRGFPMAAIRVEQAVPPSSGNPRTVRPIWRGIVIDILFFALLFAGLRWLATYPKKFIIESARLRRGHCMLCGYDLQYNFPAGCPECGWRRGGEQDPAIPSTTNEKR